MTGAALGATFDFFDEIQCLTADGREEILDRGHQRFRDVGISQRARVFNGSVVDARDLPDPTAFYGWRTRYLTSVSHREMWREASDRGVQHLLITEDDIGFVGFDPDALATAIEGLPPDWQVLFIGYIVPDPAKLPEARLLNPHLLQFSEFGADVRSGVCYALNLRYAEEILAYDPASDGVVDRWLSENLRTLCVHPLMVVEDQVEASGRPKSEWFLSQADQICFQA